MRALCLVLVLVTPVTAMDAFTAAVERCIPRVRVATGNPYFDAYVKEPGHVSFIATERDRFAFFKCMHQQGYDLEKTPED